MLFGFGIAVTLLLAGFELALFMFFIRRPKPITPTAQ